jgi:hypothetical protein
VAPRIYLTSGCFRPTFRSRFQGEETTMADKSKGNDGKKKRKKKPPELKESKKR